MILFNGITYEITGRTYWNDSVVFHVSAETESCGCGMKSWYLSFHVVEVLEPMERFPVGEEGRPYRAAAVYDGGWTSEADCEVPGCRRPIDSLLFVRPLVALSDVVFSTLLDDDFDLCLGIVSTKERYL